MREESEFRGAQGKEQVKSASFLPKGVSGDCEKDDDDIVARPAMQKEIIIVGSPTIFQENLGLKGCQVDGESCSQKGRGYVLLEKSPNGSPSENSHQNMACFVSLRDVGFSCHKVSSAVGLVGVGLDDINLSCDDLVGVTESMGCLAGVCSEPELQSQDRRGETAIAEYRRPKKVLGGDKNTIPLPRNLLPR